MAKGKKKAAKKDKGKEPTESKVGLIDKALGEGDRRKAAKREAEVKEPSEKMRLQMTALINERKKAEAARLLEEEVYFDGKGGLCKYYRISNQTIKASTLGGAWAGLVLCIVCALFFGLIGLVIDIGIQGDLEPRYHIWAILVVCGACCGTMCVCLGFAVHRKVESVETRLVTDIEFRQHCVQHCSKKKKAKIIVWSMDASTPELTLKCPGAFEVFEKLRRDIDRHRGNVEELFDDVQIADTKWGKREKWTGAILGSWGVVPVWDYKITSRRIIAEESNCCCLTIHHTSMARVYDMSASQGIFHCCLGIGTIKVFSFDRNAAPFKMTVSNVLKVFDDLREFIDAKSACTIYWTQAKTVGIVSGAYSMRGNDEEISFTKMIRRYKA